MSKLNLTVGNFISQLIKARHITALKEIFESFNEVDLAAVIEQLPVTDAFFVFKIMDKDIGGTIFSYLSSDTQEELIKQWTGNELSVILEHVYADDIADFIGDMPEEIVSKVLKSASPETRADINLLLSYQENSCGSIMTTNYVELESSDTIGQALRKVKKYGRQAKSVSNCFVLEDSKLVGIIKFKSLLFNPKNHLVGDDMDNSVYVHTTDDQEEAIRTMQKYDTTSIAVVDGDMKLVGIITADDVMDVMQQEATEDIQKMAAITPIETSYTQTSVFTMALARLPWLAVLMISASISSLILGANVVLISMYPIVSSFTPMLMDTAGNAGGQASAMVIRGITTDGLSMKNLWKILSKELVVAAVCGAVLFAVNIARVMAVMPDVAFSINLSVSLTVFVIVVVAKMVGSVLPLVATAVHLDPAVMATPLITTIVDAVSLTTFFTLVKLFI